MLLQHRSIQALFTLLSLLLLSQPGLAQQNATDSLRAEILNYQDEQALLIKNARGLILDHLEDANYPKAAEVYDYIGANVNTAIKPAFMLEEELLVLLLLRRYDQFLEQLADYRALPHNRRYYSTMYSELLLVEPVDMPDLPAWEYFLRLRVMAQAQRGQLRAQAVQQIRSAEEQEAFLLVLDYLLRDLYDYSTQNTEAIREQADLLVQRASAFYQDHPNSPYEKFIGDKIYTPHTLSDIGGGFDLSLFTGALGFTDSLQNLLHDNVSLSLGLDLSYKNVMLQMGVQGSFTRTRQDMVVRGIEWFRAERVDYTAFTFDFAYRLRAGRVTLSPFIGVSINNIWHTNIQEIPELNESRIGSTGAWQYGFNLEYALTTVNDDEYFASLSAPYVRLRGLVREPQFDRRHPGLTGRVWSLNLSVGIYLRESVPYRR